MSKEKNGTTTAKGFHSPVLEQDENGVLRIGDTVIPQRKLIYDKEIQIGANATEDGFSILGKMGDYEAGDTKNKTVEFVLTKTHDESTFPCDIVFKKSKGAMHGGFLTKQTFNYTQLLWAFEVDCYEENFFITLAKRVTDNAALFAQHENDPWFFWGNLKIYEIIE